MNNLKYLSLYKDNVPGFKNQNGGQARGNCPFHDEKTKENKPFSVNLESGIFFCHSCSQKGNAWQFCEKLCIDPKQYGLLSEKKKVVLDGSLIDKYHQNLVSHSENIRSTWDIKTIKTLKVGWCDKKKTHTFPIYDNDGNAINLKYHKDVQTKGAVATLFPINLLKDYDTSYLVICEGEPDVVTLLSNGIQACTSTGGGMKVPDEISPIGRFEKIFLCPDYDEVGDKFLKDWEIRLRKEFPDSCVRFCDLSKYVNESGDVSDYFQLQGKSKETFKTEIMKSSEANRKPFKNLPSGAKRELKSEWFRRLKPILRIVYTQLLARANEHPVVMPNFNGLRVTAQKGDWIGSAEIFASYCGESDGKKIRAKRIQTAWEKLETFGKIKLEVLKKGNCKKCTRVSLLTGGE